MSRQTQPIASRSDQRSRPPLPLQVWGATDKGLQREGNEDSIYPESGAEFFTPSPEMVPPGADSIPAGVEYPGRAGFSV